jgi:uncharacterized protein
MRTFALVLLLATPFFLFAQNDSKKAFDDIKAFQEELNKEYKDPKKSPLEPKALRRFKKHDFFPVDLKYRVVAQLVVTENTPFFSMKTTTDRLPNYRRYGFIQFTLDGKDFQLPIYQSQDLMRVKTYEDYLFLPFTDLTNGTESYSGGRYLEVRIPKEGTEVMIDFNKAYNPYCVYNDRYSCPIVPAENNLPVEIRAGVRYTPTHKEK